MGQWVLSASSFVVLELCYLSHRLCNVCSGYQTAVLRQMVSLQQDVKELKQQVDQSLILLQGLCSERAEAYDLQLPDGLQLPLTSNDDVQNMEAALTDDSFRRRLVKLLALRSKLLNAP